MEDGIMNHVMIIHSDRDVRNGTVELMVCGEQSDEEMNILSSNLGVPNCNRITNLAFNAGVCRIKFRFADNMMHAVKTRLYYED